jgi:23S rRNA (guanine745-N1)-methyltransferase
VSLPALSALACPHCGLGLDQAERRLHCASGHSFDLARQGYAPLLAKGANTTTGDTADQVAARESFLATGAYDPLMEAVARAAATDAPGVVVEPGCGTGRYAAVALDAAPGREGIGLDTSKYALRRAARTHERLAAILADAWTGLPVRDGAAAAVLNVFAPRQIGELARILHPDGVLVVLIPREDHLRELVERLDLLRVDPGKSRRTADLLDTSFRAESVDELRYAIALERQAVVDLVSMGPSARHLDREAIAAAVAALPVPVRGVGGGGAPPPPRWRPLPDNP